MATKEQLLDLLRVQRDRIADQIDGAKIAVQANNSLPALLALLVPGFGAAVYVTARFFFNGDITPDEMHRRIALAQGVVDKLEEMGNAVQVADPSSATWPAVERSARELAAAAARVNLTSDAIDVATRTVGNVFDAISRIPEVLPGIGAGLGFAAAGLALLLLVLRR